MEDTIGMEGWDGWRWWQDDGVFFSAALVELALGLLAFVSTLVITAPFGRHTSTSKDAWYWGPKIPATVAWVVMECPSPILVACFYFFLGHRPLQWANHILFLLFELHYINRTFVYPLRMKAGTPMHAMVMSQAFIFNLLNGFLQGYLVANTEFPEMDYMDMGMFWFGVATFLWGWWKNYEADDILRNLRKPGDTVRYKIPRGGAYEWVSSANYFGECVEWLGWALASRSIAGWSFAVFTWSNLVPRALSHHKWYLSKFEDYPKERMAIIPYLL